MASPAKAQPFQSPLLGRIGSSCGILFFFSVALAVENAARGAILDTIGSAAIAGGFLTLAMRQGVLIDDDAITIRYFLSRRFPWSEVEDARLLFVLYSWQLRVKRRGRLFGTFAPLRFGANSPLSARLIEAIDQHLMPPQQ